MKKILKYFIPKKFNLMLRFWQQLGTRKMDPEFYWIKKQFSNKKGRLFIDVGSNLGFYSFGLKGFFKSVVAFEPLESVSRFLIDSKIENISVFTVACSNINGDSNIYIPVINKKIEHSYAGLDIDRKHSTYESRKITTKRLDSYDFNDVDCIKIDVEGFEMKVIEGAYLTIKRSLPILIIELENRHRAEALESMILYLSSNFGYRAYFLSANELVPLDGFNLDILQRLDEYGKPIVPYVNNFIFRIENINDNEKK